jgi:hypothetical protein
MMFFLASQECQMEQVASSILLMTDHVPQSVDPNVFCDEGEPDEIPRPKEFISSFSGII